MATLTLEIHYDQKKIEIIKCEYYSWKIFQRKGVYYADGRSGNKFNLGKHSLGTKNKVEISARLKLLDQKIAKDHGLISESTMIIDSESLPISEITSNFLIVKKQEQENGIISLNTYISLNTALQKHLAYCQHAKVTSWLQVNYDHLAKYHRSLLKNKHTDCTIWDYIMRIKQLNNFLLKKGLIQPQNKIQYKVTKPNQTTTFCYSKEQVQRILEECQKIKPGSLYALVLLLSHTGMRINEALALKWKDVDLEHNVIKIANEYSSRIHRDRSEIRKTKSRKERRVPLHPVVKEVLSRINQSENPYVINENGMRLSYEKYRDVFKSEIIEPLSRSVFKNSEGFSQACFHSFRHFFVTTANELGYEKKQIMHWVGHQDLKIQEYYQHLNNNDASQKYMSSQFVCPISLTSVADKSVTLTTGEQAQL